MQVCLYRCRCVYTDAVEPPFLSTQTHMLTTASPFPPNPNPICLFRSPCQRKVAAHKRLSIEKPPPVLTIHLKRFSGYSGGKVDRWISFETTLDLQPFTSKEKVMSDSKGEGGMGGGEPKPEPVGGCVCSTRLP